jgi:hypothetical protein
MLVKPVDDYHVSRQKSIPMEESTKSMSDMRWKRKGKTVERTNSGNEHNVQQIFNSSVFPERIVTIV